VVIDRDTEDELTRERLEMIRGWGVDVFTEVPEGTRTIFCGGSYTSVAEYLRSSDLDLLVGNGGYAGPELVPAGEELKKFKDRTRVRTFNFNLDVGAICEVLYSDKIAQRIFVTKDVCHDRRNTHGSIHIEEFLDGYELSPTKRLHDLLMVKEGLCYMRHSLLHMGCMYASGTFYHTRHEYDRKTEWRGARTSDTSTLISTCYKD
jgi:hypothetical protein